ncbi:hypothetical protein [Nitrosospira sp. Is2]|uniref:hypothetical protein n=1 Tax=Nitrosospira sp. Is2 TaxID=3080532 RepID=UPI002953EC45|nr:hypothetical protein [Nitrosospira sp. Is2]WON75037.1 hypothetical protein R5L00_06025 [Nitrosospira sp. Is2]
MRHYKSMISIAVGSVFATSLGAAFVVNAADDAATANNPFALQSLDKGYMIAYADRADPGKYGMGAKGGMGAKAGEGKCGMSLADTNKDGKVTKEEFLKHHEIIFDQIDANHDGSVDKTEADNFGGGKSNPGSPAPMKK